MDQSRFPPSASDHLVSICIPTYNGSEYLAKALRCAAAQTYPHLEILIVDDASSDDSFEIAQAIAAGDNRMRVVRNAKGLGGAGNCNECISLARGRWIKFLFQDDLIEPTCIERLVQHATRHGLSFVACPRKIIFEPGVPEAFRASVLEYVERNRFATLFPASGGNVAATVFAQRIAASLFPNFVGEPTAVLFEKAAAVELGGLNTDLIQLADWDFWIRLGSACGFGFVDEELATFRMHQSGSTMRNHSVATYRAQILEPLIVLSLVIHDPRYSAVLRAAEAGGIARTLRHRFRVQQMEAHYASHMPGSDAELRRQWDSAVARYPVLNRSRLSRLATSLWARITSRLGAQAE